MPRILKRKMLFCSPWAAFFGFLAGPVELGKQLVVPVSMPFRFSQMKVENIGNKMNKGIFCSTYDLSKIYSLTAIYIISKSY